MSYNPAGKGDGKRPVNGETYRNNYDLIFSKEKYDDDCPECGRYRCKCEAEQDPDHDRQCDHDLED